MFRLTLLAALVALGLAEAAPAASRIINYADILAVASETFRGPAVTDPGPAHGRGIE